jgi:hypothetical protein
MDMSIACVGPTFHEDKVTAEAICPDCSEVVRVAERWGFFGELAWRMEAQRTEKGLTLSLLCNDFERTRETHICPQPEA